MKSPFWRQLVQADRLIQRFRSSFVGKASPVHFFWGGFDLTCTRFSGRTAPTHPGGVPNCSDWVMEEGYSEYPISPDGDFYSERFGEFLLPYEVVRAAADPDRRVLEFLETTYAAAAELGGWDRAALETDPSRWHHR